jgi:hypothetical protein
LPNHSETTSTLRYIGITTEEVLQDYDDYALQPVKIVDFFTW